jgi:predicted NBD/HSP70 family sugar kinase
MITTVDVGASKTLVAQFNSSGEPQNRIKFATPQDQDEFYEELASTLKKIVDIDVLSIGFPGIVDPLGVIKRCGRLTWTDFDLKGRLQQDIGCKVLIENDAKMGAQGEANALSPVHEMCLYVTVSTGLGDGVVQNGRLVDALKYSEAGHMMFFEDNKWQTWQDITSGKAIKQHFGKLAKDITDPDDWAWVSEKLALGLSALIPTVQPDTVIFGGSVGRYFDNYKDALINTLTKRLPAYIKMPELVEAKHPEEAVIYGCYHYATHQQNS